MQKENLNDNQPLKIMFLIDWLIEQGGAEQNLMLLAKELTARGHEISICCFKGGEFSHKLHGEGFTVNDLNSSKVLSFKGIKSIFYIAGRIKREKISVILTYHESSDIFGIIVSFLTGVPIISSRRDMGYQLKKKHVFTYRFINRFFDSIHTVSNAVREYLIRVQHVQPSKITVIHNGVIGPKCTDNGVLTSNIKEDSYTKICCVANIRPIKGYEFLVDSIQHVIDKFSNVRFYFIGKFEVDSPYYQNLLEKIVQNNLQKTIVFTDAVPNNQIPEILALMDIIVLPSKSEGMPNALLEAMAVGKPIVATKVGGVPEVVEDGKNGFLVPYGCSEAMAEKLIQLLNNPNLRKQMGEAGRALAESKFSIKFMVDKYEDLIQYVFLKRGPLKLFYKQINKIKTITRVWNFLKVTCASIIFYFGVFKIFLWVKSIFKLGRAKILAFHDVNNGSLVKKISGICILPEHFDKMLTYLYERYKIVTLEEAIRIKKNDIKLPSDVFALTFDDCYLGWYYYVMTKCRKLEIPYTLFINTSPLDTGEALIYDKIIYLLENTWRKVADLTKWGLGLYLLGSPYNISIAIKNIHKNLFHKHENEQKKILSEMYEYFSISKDNKINDLNLTWPHLKEIYINGGSIGAHSVNHIDLGNAEKLLLTNEINESKERIEKKLGIQVKYFAYPFGGKGNYNDQVTEAVKKAGFANAMTLEENGKRENDFNMGRVSVNCGMFCYNYLSFNKALLAIELSGLGNYLFLKKNIKNSKLSFKFHIDD